MKTRTLLPISAILIFILCVAALPARAQWLTQSIKLNGGWNAVYLHVDSSHTRLDELIRNDASNPIQEVWMWVAPASVQQFVQSPQDPSNVGNQWVNWVRADAVGSSALQRLTGNAACLVRVTAGVSYVWNVKGKPVPPQYQWTTTGLNFIGFPTPQSAAPTFEDFLAKAPVLAQTAEIYRYPGGELGANNPIRLFTTRSTRVNRGEAYWIRTGTSFNRYFGPFDVQLQSSSGVAFHDNIGQYQLRVRNNTADPVTITLNLIDSEAPPSGQTPIVQAPPLLVRGPLNLTNLTYGYSALNGATQTWTLPASGQPGSDIQVIFGLNRSAMTGAAGSLYAGILRFTDNFGLSQVDLPVSGETASSAGLWVGSASVTSVAHYLKKFAHATNQVDFINLLARLELTNGVNGTSYVWDETSGRVLVFGGADNKAGSYLLDGPIKTDSGAVARPFPLRLIVHNDGTTNRLMRQVFAGTGLSTNQVVATREALLLPSSLASAHRITAVHLPVSADNTSWPMNGAMQQGGSLSTTIDVDYNDQGANPFLHTYHPDHDNLDPLFQNVLPRGVESYGIRRQITLNFGSPADNFDSLTMGSQALSGNYIESVTFLGKGADSKTFQSAGTFALKRISNIATLTQ